MRVGPQPTDSVPGDETVKVQQDLINGYKFNLLDFGGSLQDSLGCGSQLTKPSELALAIILIVVEKFVSVVYRNYELSRCAQSLDQKFYK